jgi:hypothetical protein
LVSKVQAKLRGFSLLLGSFVLYSLCDGLVGIPGNFQNMPLLGLACLALN